MPVTEDLLDLWAGAGCILLAIDSQFEDMCQCAVRAFRARGVYLFFSLVEIYRGASALILRSL
jgi:hypothetical protein